MYIYGVISDQERPQVALPLLHLAYLIDNENSRQLYGDVCKLHAGSTRPINLTNEIVAILFIAHGDSDSLQGALSCIYLRFFPPLCFK